jgi:hypothetical protein
MPSNNRTVFSLIIINKAGGLIYQREFQPGLRKLSTNDYLVLAGTFHGYATPSPVELEDRLTLILIVSTPLLALSPLNCLSHNRRPPPLPPPRVPPRLLRPDTPIRIPACQ